MTKRIAAATGAITAMLVLTATRANGEPCPTTVMSALPCARFFPSNQGADQ